MPSGTVFEYYWSVGTPLEELEEVLRTIEKIEKTYTSGIEKLLRACLEESEIELDRVINIITKKG